MSKLTIQTIESKRTVTFEIDAEPHEIPSTIFLISDNAVAQSEIIDSLQAVRTHSAVNLLTTSKLAARVKVQMDQLDRQFRFAKTVEEQQYCMTTIDQLGQDYIKLGQKVEILGYEVKDIDLIRNSLKFVKSASTLIYNAQERYTIHAVPETRMSDRIAISKHQTQVMSIHAKSTFA